MFNPAQISAQLAKLPDHALKQYATMHKNDPYTVALAVSEFNRRQQLRTAATPMPQGEQPKVVDQQLAQMAPEPMPEETGIAQLPAGEMEFAEGGVIGFAQGDLVSLGGAQYPVIGADPKTGEDLVDYRGVPTRRSMLEYGERQRLADEAAGPSMFSFGWQGLARRPKTEAPTAKATPTAIPDMSDMARELQKGTQYKPPKQPELGERGKEAERQDEKGSGVLAAARSRGIASLEGDPVTMSKKFVDQYIPESSMPKVPTGIEALAEGDKMAQLAGVDTQFYKKQQEEMAADREKLSGDREWQTNMRLVEIGLGIAGGTSQHALENISKGAMPGLKGMQDDLKEFRKNEQLLKGEERKLALAQQQYNQTRSDKAQSKVEKAQDRLDQLTTLRNKLAFDMGKTYVEQQGAERRTAMQMERYGAMERSQSDREERRERSALFKTLADSATQEINKIVGNSASVLDKTAKARVAALSQQRDEALRMWATLQGVKLPQNAAGGSAGSNVIDFSSLPR